MATTRPHIDLPTAAIEAFCHKWDVSEFALFGDVVSDDFGPDSEIDVAVNFSPNRRLQGWGTVDMKLELEDLFGKPVNVVPIAAVRNPLRKRRILRDRLVVYAA